MVPSGSGMTATPPGTGEWAIGKAWLAAGSSSPLLPPNLFLPDGTLWRVDVPWDGGEPLASGELEYGVLPAAVGQGFPAQGAPQGLVPGQDYYLYVDKDVAIPITRCVFTY